MTRPTCLLLPESWSKYSTVLHNLADRRNEPEISNAIKKLEGRNRRLSSSPTNAPVASQTSAGRVYNVLDSVGYDTTIRIENLSNDCMEIISNAPHLISVVLQWASSNYRRGSHRVYLAIRLLRKWAQLGADIYESIVSYLHNLSWAGATEPSIIFRIIAELVRSKTFPAGRYLQWLIATGSLGPDVDMSLVSILCTTPTGPLIPSQPASWPVRLITEIPLSGLPDQVRTLRCTLLRGTPYSAEFEEQILDRSRHSISQTLPALCGLVHPTMDSPKMDVDALSTTVKLELGIWLRQQVARYTEVNMQ
jgi:mediator of RNA polymerase II transcription subunit 12